MVKLYKMAAPSAMMWIYTLEKSRPKYPEGIWTKYLDQNIQKVQNDNMSANTLVYWAESESNGMRKYSTTPTPDKWSLLWSQGDGAI